MEKTFKLVVFSGPGGGKTTWMKRLASFYGMGNRDDIGDCLPEREMFPIWIRCRQFKEGTPLSILEIIHEIPERAGFASDTRLKKSFFELANIHIQKGTALVLVDGLDEIGSKANRQEFIGKLNRFAETYEKANIVITSRSLGYELLTKNLSIDFTPYHIESFKPDDIMRLCIGWHKIHFGDKAETVEDAKNLSHTIVENERIFKLAQTPVLLTTLLLVKRRVGQLPTKRAALYKEAIEVLLYSWGTDARNPIDLDEALPQLAYLAYHMMFRDKSRQTIGKTELKQVLSNARSDLSQFFFGSETIDQFISRVEDRSELLVMRGHRSLNADSEQIEEVYEFSHLTFQEYLAACAIVEGYYPGATRDSRVSDCFRDVLEKDDMREVILLTSVMTKWWGAKDIVDVLLKMFSDIRGQRHKDRATRIIYLSNLLMQIIADEAPLMHGTREAIYNTCFDGAIFSRVIEGIMAVYSSKYREELHNKLISLDETSSIGGIYIPLFELIESRKNSDFSVYQHYIENINSEKFLEAIKILDIAAWLGKDWLRMSPENIITIKTSFATLCLSDNTQFVCMAFSVLGRVGTNLASFFTNHYAQS